MGATLLHPLIMVGLSDSPGLRRAGNEAGRLMGGALAAANPGQPAS